jgi:hypothetical protein
MSDTPIEFPSQASPAPLPAGDTAFGLPGTRFIPRANTVRPIIHGSTAPVIEIDKLYPADKDSKSDLIAALPLLADAIELLQEARTAARDKKIFEADRYSQRFQMLLPQLFMRRGIGDGYGVIVNSLHFAFVNQHGTPLNFEQITTVWRVVKELRSAPFVPFEQALKSVGELEDCHLRVDPQILSELIEEPEDE